MCIETAFITKDNTNKFHFSISKSFGRGESHGKNWFKPIFEKYESFICAGGSALKGLADPYNCSHLQQRFLDALMWYGQGVVELLPATQIIKFILALEFITIPAKEKVKNNNNKISKTLAKRVRLLCSQSNNLGNLEKDVTKIYNVRSRIVHGDYSPISEELRNVATLAEKITRVTLFNALAFYLSINQRNKKAKSKDLDKEFKLWRARIANNRHRYKPIHIRSL